MVSQMILQNGIGKDVRLIQLIASLVALSVFACLLVAVRIYWSGHITYIFLVWNLFLAWMPLFIALFIWLLFRNGLLNITLWSVMACLWLLFYPNAPYIITDLVHLDARSDMPFWFDQILLLSFIVSSLLVGYLSLYMMHYFVKQFIGKWSGRFLSFLSAC